MEVLFWLSTFLFIVNYFAYPLAVVLVSMFVADEHEQKLGDESYRPSISLIIAAYNEENVIGQKIENSLTIDYPGDRLEIIVVSDGSDDKTHEIALAFKDEGVVAMHEPERKGKSAAINRAAETAQGEILVFSDANNDFNRQSLSLLARHFFDESIGAVTGAKHIYQEDDREAAMGDGLYWKYESTIKKAESRIGSITSGDGEIFAVRKSVFNPIDTVLINDDAAITFDIVKQKYRVLYESGAKSFEQASRDLIEDFNVKVRMAAGGYQSIASEWSFLFPPLSWFTLSFMLHKVLRWIVPLLLVIIYLTSISLASSPFYFTLAMLQTLFYGVSIFGWRSRKSVTLPSYIYIPTYFSVMNLALLFGLYRYVFGNQKVQWKKAER